MELLHFSVYRPHVNVVAERMNRTEAKQRLGRDLIFPLEEEMSDDTTFGYVMTIGDDNYLWLPEELFNRGFSEVRTRVDRMKAEAKDLSEKISRACHFLYCAGGYAIPEEERMLLKSQMESMTEYRDRLQTRINLAEQREAQAKANAEKRREKVDQIIEPLDLEKYLEENAPELLSAVQ